MFAVCNKPGVSSSPALPCESQNQGKIYRKPQILLSQDLIIFPPWCLYKIVKNLLTQKPISQTDKRTKRLNRYMSKKG